MKMLIKAMVLFLSMLLVGSCDSSTENNGGDAEPDSTTQNFTFEEFEFGDGGNSSYFNDVWIFDENNIWAVGWVGILPGYENINVNIMRWNGAEWKVFPYSGSSSGIEGIWAQDSSNIYFAIGAVIKYQNGEIIEYDMGDLNFSQGQSVEHLWGSSESNIWGVGPWGTLVHYNGSKWSKLDFDTQYHIYDVTGSKETGTAYAVAWQYYTNHVLIIKLDNSGWETVFDAYDMGLSSRTITKGPGDELYLAGGFGDTRIWTYNIKEKSAKVNWTLPSGQSVLSQCMYSEKDIYFFGDDGSSGKMIHYNGKRLTVFPLFSKDPVGYGGSFAIKDFAAYCGFANNKAFIIFIKRS